MVSDQSTPDFFKGTPDGDYYSEFVSRSSPAPTPYPQSMTQNPSPVTAYSSITLSPHDPITHASPRNLEPPRQPDLEHDHDQQESTANEVLPIRIELKCALATLEIQRHENQSQ